MAHGQSCMAEPVDAAVSSWWQLERASWGLPSWRVLAGLRPGVCRCPFPDTSPCIEPLQFNSPSHHPSSPTFHLKGRLRGTVSFISHPEVTLLSSGPPFGQAVPRSMCWPATSEVKKNAPHPRQSGGILGS